VKRYRLLAALIAFPFSAPAAAQPDDPSLPSVAVPRLTAEAANPQAFVPAGWRVETSVRGDLNRDGRSDLAFVLRTARAVTTTTPYGMSAGQPFDGSPRLFAAALATTGGRYRLAFQTHLLIPRPYTPIDDEWMFEEGSLRIERGTLVIVLSHLGSSAGARTFRLRWQDGAFRLIGYDFTDVHRYSHCTNTVSVNYSTRRMRTGFAPDGGAPERERWRTLPARPLLTVDRIGDGMAFDPEGAVSAIRC
jgi:hypothetical protein